MSTHTPGPWEIAHPIGSDSVIYRPANGPMGPIAIGRIYARDDARFVIHACNCHDELLAALEAALNMVDGDGAPPDWDAARSAIARAKGESEA